MIPEALSLTINIAEPLWTIEPVSSIIMNHPLLTIINGESTIINMF